MDRLTELEQYSIYILREAQATVPSLGMLWSMGKDSTALAWIARKAFFGTIPFPLIHIDTSYKIPEMIEFRDKKSAEWNAHLIVSKNEAALASGETFPCGKVDRITCCKTLKSIPLRNAIGGKGDLFERNHQTNTFERIAHPRPFGGVIVAIRGDEEGTRSKERVFSPRQSDQSWDLEGQPAEVWNYFQTVPPKGGHLRIHPLLEWTEVDVWEYVAREKIELPKLYFDQGDRRRYRSLGCAPCTQSIESSAKDLGEVIVELRSGSQSRVSERSGRAQDREDGGGLETLRRGGYM